MVRQWRQNIGGVCQSLKAAANGDWTGVQHDRRMPNHARMGVRGRDDRSVRVAVFATLHEAQNTWGNPGAEGSEDRGS